MCGFFSCSPWSAHSNSPCLWFSSCRCIWGVLTWDMVLPLDVCRAPFRAYIPSFQPAQHRRSSLSGINPGKIYSNHGSLFSNHDTLARVHLHHVTESLHRWLEKQCSPGNTLNGGSPSITHSTVFLTAGSEVTALGSASRCLKERLLLLCPDLVFPCGSLRFLSFFCSFSLVPLTHPCEIQATKHYKKGHQNSDCCLIVGDLKTSYLIWCHNIYFIATYMFLCQV